MSMFLIQKNIMLNCIYGKLLGCIKFPIHYIDYGTQFTAQYLKSIQKGLGNYVKLNTNFNPHIDGQVECTIYTHEDMLTASGIEFMGNWDYQMTMIDFTYNNRYHSSII